VFRLMLGSTLVKMLIQAAHIYCAIMFRLGDIESDKASHWQRVVQKTSWNTGRIC